MKQLSPRRVLTTVLTGGILMQFTACLGPDPRGFIEDSFLSALFANLFAAVSATLLQNA